MSYPVTQYPLVRTVTQLIRTILPDEPIGLGFVFIPLSAICDAGGNVTLIFQTPPGFVQGDSVNLSGFAPNAWNGVYSVSSVAGTQIQFVNVAVVSTSPTTIGTVQGYGTGRNYTDTKLVPLVNSAYRSLQRALKMAGSTELKVSRYYVTIPAINQADPSCVVNLGFNGLTITSDMNPPPTWLDISVPIGALPQDCLRPLKLWERQTGTSNEFVEMVDLTEEGGLPSRTQSFNLSVWEWVEDSLEFIGAQQDVDIAIRYQRGLPYLGDGGAQILIEDSQEYMAYQACALLGLGRKNPNDPTFSQMAEDSKDKLVSAETRAQQYVSRRPRGYSSRNGPRVWRF